MVQMKIGGHLIDLMVDTGSTHLVVTQLMGPLSQRHATIVRATGDQTHCPFLV
jgi:predicted aspartyl protease